MTNRLHQRLVWSVLGQDERQAVCSYNRSISAVLGGALQ